MTQTALTKEEANQAVQLTKGDVERLISLGLERGRSEAMALAGGSQKMTIGELKQWAGIIRMAGLIPADKANQAVPDAVLEARAIAKIMAGNDWGIQPFEAQSLFHFIPTSGTIVPDYKALLMRIKISGKYDYEIVELTEEICTVRGFRKMNGKMEAMSPDISFTKAEAINAGLYSEAVAEGTAKYPNGDAKKKGAWEAYTKDKLLARATNRLFKRHFPDLYSSVHQTKEDVEDAMLANEVIDVEAPKQIEAPKTPADEPFTETYVESPEYVATPEPADRSESIRADLETAANDLIKDLTGGDAVALKRLLKGRQVANMSDAELTAALEEWRNA